MARNGGRNENYDFGFDNFKKTTQQSSKQWKAYNAVSRYEIEPKLVDWYYPTENYLESRAERFISGPASTKNNKVLDFDINTPRHRIDDHAIAISNAALLDKLFPVIFPPESYFEPGELDVINGYQNPLKASCRQNIGLFLTLAYKKTF